jgi:hypothetical protein
VDGNKRGGRGQIFLGWSVFRITQLANSRPTPFSCPIWPPVLHLACTWHPSGWWDFCEFLRIFSFGPFFALRPPCVELEPGYIKRFA